MAVDGSGEFSGERAGSTSYRVTCPHDKTPMVPDARAKGGETMRCLGYLKCVIAYLNGMLNHPLPERPRAGVQALAAKH